LSAAFLIENRDMMAPDVFVYVVLIGKTERTVDLHETLGKRAQDTRGEVATLSTDIRSIAREWENAEKSAYSLALDAVRAIASVI
jgi:hypothetical protein